MPHRVLITRPEPSASLLAERIHALGYVPVLAPMLRLQPAEAFTTDYTKAQILLLTSAHALLFIPPAIVALFCDRPCLCVGAATAEAARAAGFKQIETAEGSGAMLATYLLTRYPSRELHLLHACGANTAPALCDILRDAGYQIFTWRLYEAQPAEILPADLCAMLMAQNISVALFYSPRTASIFVRLAMAANMLEHLAVLDAVVISNVVEAALLPWQPRHLSVASTPTESAILACLTTQYPALSAP